MRDRKLLELLRANNKYRKEEEEKKNTEAMTYPARLARFDTPFFPYYLIRQLYLEPSLDGWFSRQDDFKL